MPPDRRRPLRFKLQACEEVRRLPAAAGEEVLLILVDASSTAVRGSLARSCPGVRVVPQAAAGKKGVALREGIAEAKRVRLESSLVSIPCHRALFAAGEEPRPR